MATPSASSFGLTWLGHDAFKIVAGGKVVYFDPFQLSSPQEPADVVCLTHEHFDHFSPNDLAVVARPQTTIIASALIPSEKLGSRSISVRPGERHVLEGLTIETVPAYNLNKHFHPKGDPRVGFILTIENKRIYHAGDTDAIPEMEELKDIDVALVPVSGTYVMTAEEAAAAVNRFRPKLAIPMHYGAIIGSRDDAERFKTLAEVPVEIFSPAT